MTTVSTENLHYKKEKNYPALRYSVLSGDSFEKPDIFPTTILSSSYGQKAGLMQSSFTQSLELPVHTD